MLRVVCCALRGVRCVSFVVCYLLLLSLLCYCLFVCLYLVCVVGCSSLFVRCLLYLFVRWLMFADCWLMFGLSFVGGCSLFGV